MLTAGALSILVQTVLLGELMAAAHGTELTLGFGLAAWLLGGAAGSFLSASWLQNVTGSRGLKICFISAGILGISGLIFLRGFKPLAGYLPGEGISLGHMALLSLAAMAINGLAFGAIYVFGTRFLEEQGQQTSGGVAYWAEAAGSLAGGAAFTFLLAFKLSSSGAVMISAGLAAFGAAWTGPKTSFRMAGTAALVASAMASAVIGSRIEAATLAWSHTGYKLTATAYSPYGRTVSIQRQGQQDVFHNGYPVFHSPIRLDPALEELAAWGLLSADTVGTVLLVGGAEIAPLFLNLGCRVDYAEIDPQLLAAVMKVGRSVPESLLASPRLNPANVDAFALLKHQNEEYDLVLLSQPPPATVSQNRYYTQEFFDVISRALRPGGAVALKLPGSQAALDQNRARLLGSVASAMEKSLPGVVVIPGEAFFMVGRKQAVPMLDSLLVKRFEKIDSAFGSLSAGHLRHRLEERRRRGEELSALMGFGPNRAFNPRSLAPGIILWQRAFSPGWAETYRWLIKASWWLWPLLALGFLWPRMRHRGAAFTSGAAAMGLQALCLWGLQIRSGALYQWLGLGNALFMAGTAAGAWIRTTWLWARSVSITQWEMIFAIWALAFLLGQLFWEMPGVVFLAGSAITGAVLGLEFPALVAGRAGQSRQEESAAAGSIYAWDLAGGFFAALAVGVVLIPAWGMAPTAAFMAGLKLLSLRWWLQQRGV